MKSPVKLPLKYTVAADSGRMRQARQVPSPNFDQRPPGMRVDLIVVHGISLPPGEYGGPWIDQLFTNTLDSSQHAYFRKIAGLRVSSHLLIRRTGELVQYVSFKARAWHAGQSSFEGRAACNDFSIGIELEGSDDTPYENSQYTALAASVSALCSAYPDLALSRIVGHSDIAPGRKSDPGPGFDWPRARSLFASQGRRTKSRKINSA